MPGGRPKAFASPEELEQIVSAYLTHCEENEKHLGVAGLASFAGVDRSTILRYGAGEYGPEFCDPIKKAVAAIESYQEGMLLERTAVAGVIFSLKNNHGWRDKFDLEHGGKLEVTAIKRTIVGAD